MLDVLKDWYPPASFPLGAYALFQSPKHEAIVNIAHVYIRSGASLVEQMVKNLPAMWETCVWSLGWEDPLEKEMETHSSILTWRIPWTEEPGGLQSMGLQQLRRDWVTNTHTYTHKEYVLNAGHWAEDLTSVA